MGTKVVNLYLSRTHLYFGGGLKLENGQNKLVIVSSEVLPDIVLKVLAAKRMRARGSFHFIGSLPQGGDIEERILQIQGLRIQL